MLPTYCAGVLSTMSTRTARHSRWLLGGGVGLVLVCLSIQPLIPRESGGRFALTSLLFSLAIGSAIVAAVFWSRARPAVFALVARTRGFRTLPHISNAFIALAMMFFTAANVAWRLGRGQWRPDSPSLDLALGVLVAVTAVHTVAVWRDVIGVHLLPDCLVARGPFGTLTVPWDAPAPGYPLPAPPAATHLTVVYARPELVRRRGLILRGRIPVDNVDPLFLGYAIAFYVANPQRRQAIGTETEYQRLLHEPNPETP